MPVSNDDVTDNDVSRGWEGVNGGNRMMRARYVVLIPTESDYVLVSWSTHWNSNLKMGTFSSFQPRKMRLRNWTELKGYRSAFFGRWFDTVKQGGHLIKQLFSVKRRPADNKNRKKQQPTKRKLLLHFIHDSTTKKWCYNLTRWLTVANRLFVTSIR